MRSYPEHAERAPRQFLLALPFAALLTTLPCVADSSPALRQGECLVIGGVVQSGRSPVHTDAIEAQIINGTWRRPAAGDRVQLPNGSFGQWEALHPGTNGWFENRSLRNGYACVPVMAASNCVGILQAEGDSLAYVNGVPRAGDPYEYGYVRLPVSLRAGTNDILFLCGQSRLKFTLTAPSHPVCFNPGDTTLPDLIAGEPVDAWGAVAVVNATEHALEGLAIRAAVSGEEAGQTAVPIIPPLSVRKVGFHMRAQAQLPGMDARLELMLLGNEAGARATLDSTAAKLRVRRAGQVQKRTFISDIDGSIQYWALNPAQPIHRNHPPLALFLSLHGASVEALSQAGAYEPKSWGYLVAPTNRRPYGFDWEDWGRLDALEVLEIAKEELRTDTQRIYLTGHSMGGHGAWQLAALYPDHFAAVGVSAGWISFFSYAGGWRLTNATPVEAMLQRAAAMSDTLLMQSNYLQEGLYILHGSQDDNVPVTEARHMEAELSRFDHDFVFHEQAGVGHWWDLSNEPGADCVDWPPMFDFFAHHVIPADESLREINFTTVNPGVSASCHWLEIEEQIHPLEPSSIHIRWDPGKRRFVGASANITRLALDLKAMKADKPFNIELDGQTLHGLAWPTNAAKLWLQRDEGRWNNSAKAPPALKGPVRNGPFKDAFRRRMMFVYGTRGSPDENAWAFDKARFDAETFWYRGNGSVDVVPDTAFDPRTDPDRSVILYGNAEINGAWLALVGDSPVQVNRTEVRIGPHVLPGNDLACLFLRPRPGSEVACVGVVSGTGLPGMKLTDRLNYFLSGVAYPDCTVIGADMLRSGAEGVRAAGFFGNDWSVENGEFAWRDQ